VRWHIDAAEKLRRAGNLRASGALEEAIAGIADDTAGIQCLRRGLRDYAEGGEGERCVRVLYGHFGFREGDTLTAAQVGRMITFVRQMGDVKSCAALFGALAGHFENSPEVASGVAVRGLARMYLDAGMTAAAEEICEREAEKLAGTGAGVDALDLLSVCHYRQGARERLAGVCESLGKGYPRSGARANAVLLLARMDKENGRYADSAKELKDLIRSEPLAEKLKEVVPDLLRAAWEVRRSMDDIRLEVADLLKAPGRERQTMLRSLRFAILGLEADGSREAARAACLGVIEHASNTPDAGWANRRLVKQLTANP
jgi:hypothetical protein